MSQTRRFELRDSVENMNRAVIYVRKKASLAQVTHLFSLIMAPPKSTLRITLTGNVDALDDLVWTLRDEFGERLREVK